MHALKLKTSKTKSSIKNTTAITVVSLSTAIQSMVAKACRTKAKSAL